MARGGEGPDVEGLDVLTDEELATPPPRPPWRAPTWALPDPGADPAIYGPASEHYNSQRRGNTSNNAHWPKGATTRPRGHWRTP